jgi:hypothetical protein
MSHKHLVIGMGEIGSAIQSILDCDHYDLTADNSSCNHESYEVIHICYPYSENFENSTISYQARFSAKLTVIHSTVPVGTSQKLSAVHSPCRGIHPHLKEGILTFVKYFGGKEAATAAKIFSEYGVKTEITESSTNTEAMKLWDTTIYGWNILLEKMIFDYCKENNLDFDIVYTHANKSYNDGYNELGRPEYKKYILKHMEGKIGGHCVISNLDLLDSDVSVIIKKYNANLE